MLMLMLMLRLRLFFFLLTHPISGVEEKLRDVRPPPFFFCEGESLLDGWMVPYHTTW